jgi:hypothetical protein
MKQEAGKERMRESGPVRAKVIYMRMGDGCRREGAYEGI